jgi:hypothetical protein
MFEGLTRRFRRGGRPVANDGSNKKGKPRGKSQLLTAVAEPDDESPVVLVEDDPATVQPDGELTANDLAEAERLLEEMTNTEEAGDLAAARAVLTSNYAEILRLCKMTHLTLKGPGGRANKKNLLRRADSAIVISRARVLVRLHGGQLILPAGDLSTEELTWYRDLVIAARKISIPRGPADTEPPPAGGPGDVNAFADLLQ